MSAIAGMNPPPSLCQASLGSLGSSTCQQPPSSSSPPFLLQGHRLSAATSPPNHGLPVQNQETNYNNKNYLDSSPDPEETQEAAEEPSPAPLDDAGCHDNQFENNANHENQDRAESPAKDATLEPESDDELFMNDGPSLDDDDEDDSFQETSAGFAQESHFDDSSNFVDDNDDTTFGSPGLREAFTEGFNGAADPENLMDPAEPSSRTGSADTSRRNRRKQFKPRSIVSRLEDESEAEGEKALVGGEESPLSDYRRSLLPGSGEREGSPMDLSAPRAAEAESDSGSESSQAAQPARRGGLSLVRPEILFGDSKPASSSMDDRLESNRNSTEESVPGIQPSPLSLLSSLSDLAPKGDGSVNAMANTMKDAFREVLKLYGVSSDVAENIVGGGPVQDKLEVSSPEAPQQPLRPLHPGMLSAALQGTLPPSHQPPTPPRTPQGHLTKHQEPASPLSMLPKMPSLLSMAALQQQMLGKPPGLPAGPHMNKHGLQGLPHGMPGMGMGMPPGAGMPPLPPHMLAAQRVGMMPGQQRVTDYTRYFKRFGSSLECGFVACKDMNYREHFHCAVPMCKGKDFAKKEEMIRHSKWHQKMDEALKYGFRRVTPMDDCSDQFQECSHNKKQTHYHCIQSEGCDKVYISTSDVQMHFNYHRKDNAIQREGFLRFRGAEDCHTTHCLYRGQRTTHFHCNRSSCQFTFKNKADMEKHKNYHMKDEQLNKDGFKKFMKHEPCGFLNCKFSRTHNHIHCIRSHCEYVLHSSGQLFSHKRKHERKDNELAYRKYKLAQSMIGGPGGQPNSSPSFPFNSSSSPDLATNPEGGQSSQERPPSSSGSLTSGSSTPPVLQETTRASFPATPLSQALSQPLPPTHSYGAPTNQQNMGMHQPMPYNVPEDAWQNYLLRFDAEEGCGFQECDVEDTEHFHCKDEGCETVFRTEEGVREHGKNHFQQDQISETFFAKVDPEEPGSESGCPTSCQYRGKEIHFHCKIDQCPEVILTTDVPFRRLDHYKIHEYTKKWNMNARREPEPVMMTMTTNIDTMFKRKRGRPPKNRVIEVFDRNFGGGSAGAPGMPQAVFTSFKLPKPGAAMAPTDFPAPAFSSSAMGMTNSPFSFSVSPLRPPVPHFTTTTQFDIKPPGPEVSGINLGPTPPEETPHAPTAPQPQQEDGIQKVQESNNNNQSENESSSEEVTPPKNQGLIKARGTYFPLTAFPTSMPQGSVMRSTASPPASEAPTLPTDEASPPISMKSKIGVNFLVSVGRNPDTGDNALAKLLQGFANSDKGDSNPGKHLSSPPALSPIPERRDPMGSPSRQEMTPSPSRMLSPSAQSPRLLQSSSPISVPTSPSSASLTPNSSALNFANPFMSGAMNAQRQFQHLSTPGLLPPGMNPFFPHAGMMLPGGMHNPFQRFPTDPRIQQNLFDPTKQFPRPGWPGGLGGPQKRSIIDDDEAGMTMDQKKLRLQSSMRMLKDEPVPEGYMRFRFNEDCQFSNCNYREHQTHFHCMRKDCNYRFCDKTRFVQHTARHERLDTLCGDEFQGFRGVSCQRDDCELNVLHNTSRNLPGANQKSSSHFHCLKCDYYCTDTNKVVAHRRQHQKLDSIMAAGFEKFTPTQYCSTPGCSHNGKQTHYHCRKCQYAVLGLSQMEAHKYRHLNE